MLKPIEFLDILLLVLLSVSCKNEAQNAKIFDEVIKVITEPKNGCAKVLNNDNEASHGLVYFEDSVWNEN